MAMMEEREQEMVYEEDESFYQVWCRHWWARHQIPYFFFVADI
jgi:hypothetical protein